MNKRKVFVAFGLLLGMPALMYGLSFTMEKRYTAQVRLLVDPASAKVDNPTAFGPIDEMSSLTKARNAQTQVQIITGTDVLTAAMERARGQLPQKFTSQESVSGSYESLVRRLQVDSDPLSDVIGLRVTQTDPDLAAEVANDIAYAYQDYMNRLIKEGSNRQLVALRTQVNDELKQLTQLDAKIAGLKSKARIADVGISGNSRTQTAAASQQRLDEVQSQYDSVAAEYAMAKGLLATIPPKVKSSSSTSSNPAQIDLQQRLGAANADLADLRAQYLDSNPLVKAQLSRVKAFGDQLKRVNQSIAAGETTSLNPAWQNQFNNVTQLHGKVDGLRGSLNALRTAVATNQSRIDELPALEQSITALSRDRDTIQATYQQLDQRRRILETAGGARQAGVQVVSPALVPEVPSFPDTRLFLLAGLALGSFLTILYLMPRSEPPSEYPNTPYEPMPPIAPEDRKSVPSTATGGAAYQTDGP